ncbi:unnamed protein product [Gongylonema pulchrum]|uniref:Uncharacterized protein n=1 Tax=Gongylonema pulchrum TaxID=637853 RepID=A0A183E0E4_9BILA|nr:unnamed protein product [Gongylonema pulchrum]
MQSLCADDLLTIIPPASASQNSNIIINAILISGKSNTGDEDYSKYNDVGSDCMIGLITITVTMILSQDITLTMAGKKIR